MFPLTPPHDRSPRPGALVIYLDKVKAGTKMLRPPANGFDEEDPQPMYGIDVKDVQARNGSVTR